MTKRMSAAEVGDRSVAFADAAGSRKPPIAGVTSAVIHLDPDDEGEDALAIRAIIHSWLNHDCGQDRYVETGVIKLTPCVDRNHRRDIDAMRTYLDIMGLLEKADRHGGLPVKPDDDATVTRYGDKAEGMLSGLIRG